MAQDNVRVVIFIALSALAMLKEAEAITKCEYDKRCGCHTDEGYIDLTKLSKPADQPYEAVATQVSYTFFWLPCKDFTKGGVTSGALQKDGDKFYDIGAHSTANSKIADAKAVFMMEAKDKLRKSHFTCTCADTFLFAFDKEDPIGTYDFQVKGPACCPGKAPSPKPASSGSLSMGSILLIVFFGLIVVYFIVGAIVQIGVRKAEGTERVPNYSFWSALPGLIKDGFRFTFTCGRTGQYSQI